tara:strand:- start:1237 stop:2418 length:1182 start_codon:yes stop_codon:yes gene_type:complete
MTTIGTPNTTSQTKLMLLGSGELGKEVAIAAQRLGVKVIAVDRYENAPAMQVAHKSYTIPMQDGNALRALIESEKPDHIVPEIEAISTDTLVELEEEGYSVTPTARAAKLTMDREGIRKFVSQDLGIKTSEYAFADTKEDFEEACLQIGFPCVVKPIMSSSGKGQSTVNDEANMGRAWSIAQDGGRTGAGRVIVEGFVDFDYEITLLTLRHRNGTTFVDPIGHRQEDGDYQESWQPQPMTKATLIEAQRMARTVTDGLGGHGIFGVELFIRGEEVIFSELSPRPHDTGMVTMISQNLSQFALHARAILGLPIPNIRQYGPSASHVIMGKGTSQSPSFGNLESALEDDDTDLRLFGKPEVEGERRLGVCLSLGASIDEAREKAERAANSVEVRL